MTINTIRWAGLVWAVDVTASVAAGRGELKTGTGQEVRVAFDARFDADGRAIELRRHDEAEYPAAF